MSESGRVEKTIYREMVSSVKEVNDKGVKLVRRALVRAKKRWAVENELRLTFPPQPQAFPLRSGPKVSWSHAWRGKTRAPRTYETDQQWRGSQAPCHLRELWSWGRPWRTCDENLHKGWTKAQELLARRHRRVRRGPWYHYRPLGGEGSESPVGTWSCQGDCSCCWIFSVYLVLPICQRRRGE